MPAQQPGTRGERTRPPQVWDASPAVRPGSPRLTLPAGPLPASRLSKPAASVGEGGEDVIDARSSLQAAPRAPSELPSLRVDAAAARHLSHTLPRAPQPVTSSTPGPEHGGSQTPLRLVPALCLRPPYRGRLVQGKTPAKKATRRQNADETPRGARVLSPACTHPLQPRSWHPRRGLRGSETRRRLPCLAAPSADCLCAVLQPLPPAGRDRCRSTRRV